MIWGKPTIYDERRVRAYIEARLGLSETALSLAPKVGINPRHCRLVLESLAREGIVRRRDVGDIEPIFYRYPGR